MRLNNHSSIFFYIFTVARLAKNSVHNVASGQHETTVEKLHKKCLKSRKNPSFLQKFAPFSAIALRCSEVTFCMLLPSSCDGKHWTIMFQKTSTVDSKPESKQNVKEKVK